MTDIYEQHDKAFASVSAYVVLKDGNKVATIALKFPRDGAGRLYSYVHWIGSPMVRGFAVGYGYDKRSAAVSMAIRHMTVVKNTDPTSPAMDDQITFMRSLAKDDGYYFYDKLIRDGFTVLQAV